MSPGEENLITVELAKELRDSFDDLFRGKFPTGTLWWAPEDVMGNHGNMSQIPSAYLT